MDLKSAFTSDDTFGSTLIVALTDMYNGSEFLNWEPETIRMDVKDALNVDIPDNNMDKIQALSVALTTDRFFSDIDVFINVCNSLGGEGADFRAFDPAEIDEIAWAVTEILLNIGSVEGEDHPFGEDIIIYIQTQATLEGFKKLPSVLQFVPLKSDDLDNAAELGADIAAAVVQRQNAIVSDLEEELQEKLAALFNQIQSLPLRHGDSERWQQFAGKPLQVTPRRM